MRKTPLAIRDVDVVPEARKSGRLRKVKTKAKAVIERPPLPPGWLTTDDDELRVRRWRGETEIGTIDALETGEPVFGTFRVQSASGSSYDVEIRSLTEAINSCGCIDHRVNGLGTCKHIEGVIAALTRRRTKAEADAARAGIGRIEIFLDRRGPGTPALLWPAERSKPIEGAAQWLQPYLDRHGALMPEPRRIEKLIAAWNEAPLAIRRAIRLSRHFSAWLDRARRARERAKARAAFEARAEKKLAGLVKHPLLPYQRDGLLHLVFGERALLADEMGLGKTVQAIAASELLARLKGIRRVLVVCPASLKSEWEEQIARFADRATRLVFGPRAQRLAAYTDPAFFTIVNYEQVLSDVDDINSTLKPDLVILDEAQRIKNWQTKTARQVKLLQSRYAFVLTGTPLENRIDELYSIVQYLDPEILGPLFRFNREFYQLDERGRPVDYQNLGALRERLQPVLLRRRKADVEAQLPGRTVKNYFVAMADEQRLRYEDYAAQARRLLALAQKRPLTKAEFDRLQMLLACMRMICDTPAILDPTCRISPKLEELEGILEDVLQEPGRKAIIFSEWERMLAMVRELAGEMGLDAAWHTGSVSQIRRRAEINRFKHDPACRLFLSTDSGSVGLNLQAASVVINIDLPWNPAKLEQRIARAWRKGQARSVTVVNLITEDSIEHDILHLLGRKQALADGVVDGIGDLSALKMPSGRAALIERMQVMITGSARHPIVMSSEAVAAELVQRHGDRAILIEARRDASGSQRLVAVLDLDAPSIAVERERLSSGPAVELIDHASWLAVQRLAAAGMLQFTHEARTLHPASGNGAA
ncbi:MAG: DEAD/DEAH box helicase [Bradyrhizobium sp.]